jgi:hypothetical protein
VKQLTWKLVLPLTVISFVTITKWWYVDFIDGPAEILTGFPLPYVCPGWHTSLSLQIFVLELAVDILSYFTFWFLIIYLITKIFKPFNAPKILTISLLSIAGLVSFFLILLAINPDNIWTTTRENEMEILDTGYQYIWQDRIRPDYDKYHGK